MPEDLEMITLDELAREVSGLVNGNGETEIFGVCSLDNPITGFIALAMQPDRIDWSESDERPAALIVQKPVEVEGLPLLVHTDPRLAFTRILKMFNPVPEIKAGIHPTAVVSSSAEIDPGTQVDALAVIGDNAQIGQGCHIGAGCCIGNDSQIGAGTKLYPNVTIYHDVFIGERCIIHSGVVIGSDGFGFHPTADGNIKVPQVGVVEIGNDVEIGAGSTIDRATLDSTVIGDDVKIDNLVQIAHNVKIGPHSRIAAQAGLSGRVIVEENVVIAGQAGFQNGIRVGKGSIIAGQAGVTRHVREGSRVSGYPARDHRQALQILSATNRLPEILDKIRELDERTGSKKVD